MKYVRMSGAGNIFIMLDGRELDEGTDLAELARAVCSPSHVTGGADGLIAVEPWEGGGDFRMRYHNRDGSTGMMCGNGGRCAVRFAIDRGLVGDESDITLVNAGIVYRATVTNRGIRIAFPDPRAFRIGMGIDLLGTPALCHFADVGTPHAIIFVDELRVDPSRHVADVDLQRWGPPLRSHERFGEEGANANFVEVLPGSSTIVLRTFERGVEGETGACGTGAISSAIVASLLRGLTPPVEVITSSGERLWVDFRVTGESITDVTLEGGAEVIGEGELD